MAFPHEAIILDVGSGETKFGYGGEAAPRGSFPTIVGVPERSIKRSLNLKDHYIGNEALITQGLCALKTPIKYGTVLNWRDVDRIWSYIFDEQLRISAEDYNILYTEHPFSKKKNREETMQCIFEKWKARGAFAGLAPVLGLYATGRTTGFVIDSGERQTYLVPICEGNPVHEHIQYLQIGGYDLTEHLVALLQLKGLEFVTPSGKWTAKQIKERLGYVAMDFQEEVQRAKETDKVLRRYTLPDGKQIEVNGEQFLCTEPLFRPSLIGLEQQGLVDMTVSALSCCERSLAEILYRNMVLTGGNAMFPRMDLRLEAELSLKVRRWPVTVARKTSAGRKYSAWIGGSILSVMPTFQQMWITRSDYDEMGPEIVHHKCF